jgi:hypothetical protein
MISIGIIYSMTIFSVYGHGVGYEVLPPIKLGDKEVALEVTSSQYENPDNPDRQITFALFNTENGITVREVTYYIEARKGNDFLFDGTFETKDGILVMNFLHSDSDKVTIEQENKASFFETLLGGKKTVLKIKGSPFNTGGLYKFKVIIKTAESFSNVLKEPIEYDVGLSVPQRTFYSVNDPNFGTQELSIITYYDEIENFRYDPKTRSISFSMPFDWDIENINQTSIVHEEITIPKAFGDLMVSSFSASVNGLEVPDRTITIDEFSEVQRIIHLVLNQKDLLDLHKKQSPGVSGMRFVLQPSDEDLPLSTITGNGQFKIVLDWEPRDIRSGSKVTFFFDIMDVFLKDRPVSVSYDISIIYDGKKIYNQHGISTDSKDEHNAVEFVVPENVSGPITIQFENLKGNSLARIGLPVVVNRVEVDLVESSEQITIPDWVRNNAGWWSAGQIGDNDFVYGIEYMIKEGMIRIPATGSGQKSVGAMIPDWVRNNAGWWSEKLISDKEFTNGLQYLIKNGIISI